MAESLETELDRLFQLPLADLVSARNELADRLRKQGDRAAATKIKELRKPTPCAWAINQLHFRRPELLERALARAAALRALHARDGVEPQQLSAAVEAQRAALHAVVAAAVRCCIEAGIASGPREERKLLSTVQAWLAGAAEEAPGRMTRDVEPAGFAAIAEVGAARTVVAQQSLAIEVAPVAPVVAAAPLPDPRALERAAAERDRQAQAARALERATERVAERERQAQAARVLVEQRLAERERLAAEVQQLQASVREVERNLVDLRARLTRSETDLAMAATASESARSAQAQAQTAFATARAELMALQKQR